MILNLDLLGKLDDFEDVFDIASYREDKSHAIGMVRQSVRRGRPADLDLVELIKRAGRSDLL